MSYKDRAKTSNVVALPVGHNCPAHGCPNAASVSFGGGWACYSHAKAPSSEWRQVTHAIRSGWPATANWNHLEKVAYEAEQTAKRRATLPPRRGQGFNFAGVLPQPQPEEIAS